MKEKEDSYFCVYEEQFEKTDYRKRVSLPRSTGFAHLLVFKVPGLRDRHCFIMKAMIERLKQRGYEQASLAVQKENYAVTMYQKIGFKVVDESEEEYIPAKGVAVVLDT